MKEIPSECPTPKFCQLLERYIARPVPLSEERRFSLLEKLQQTDPEIAACYLESLVPLLLTRWLLSRVNRRLNVE